MDEELSEQIRRDLDRARDLHDRAASDYEKCLEFNKLMSDVLDKLEDHGSYKRANKVMSLLLDCKPKEGARCDKASLVGERVKKF